MTRILLAFLICCLASLAHAGEKLDFSHFEQLPILDNGRIKPLGSYATNKLIAFTGDNTFENKTAEKWLADIIFDPSSAKQAKIYAIKNDALKDLLGVDKKQTHFNLDEIQDGLQKTQETVKNILQGNAQDLTKDQKDLLKLHENVVTYNELIRSLSFVLPLNIEAPKQY